MISPKAFHAILQCRQHLRSGLCFRSHAYTKWPMNNEVGMGVSYSAAAVACGFLSLETQIISETPLDSMWYVFLSEIWWDVHPWSREFCFASTDNLGSDLCPVEIPRGPLPKVQNPREPSLKKSASQYPSGYDAISYECYTTSVVGFFHFTSYGG